MIRRNAALLPAYSFILGLIALLGYMAIAAGVGEDPAHAAGFARYGPNYAVPALFLASFQPWFVGVAFASIAIGALVPAAIMSIACANLFTRNLYKEFLRPDCTEAQEAQMAKIVSLVVKIGAVVFILALPQAYAIQLQLLGGIWIIQLLPPILLGLYTRSCNAPALLIGWAVGLATGTYMAATQDLRARSIPCGLRRHDPGLCCALFGPAQSLPRHRAHAGLQSPRPAGGSPPPADRRDTVNRAASLCI